MLSPHRYRSLFSSGLDVREIAEADDNVPYRQHLVASFNRIDSRMLGMMKPIIGAINGPAAGAGLGIALATDVRWAAERASFIFGFRRLICRK